VGCNDHSVLSIALKETQIESIIKTMSSRSFFHLSAIGADNVQWGVNNCFVFKTKLEESGLRASLAELVDSYYPAFNGRIVKETSSGRYALVENGAGHHFEYSVESNEPVAVEIRANPRLLATSTRFRQYFPAARPGFGLGHPLLLVKVTYFERSDLSVLTTTISHAVADASTAHSFFHHWDLVMRGQHGKIMLRPCFRHPRQDLFSRKELITRFESDVSKAVDLSAQVSERIKELQPSHDLQRLFLDGSKLAGLKNQLNSLLSPEWVSTSEMIFAIVAVVILKARQPGALSREEPVLMQTIVNIRGRTRLFPDDSFAGNGFCKPLVAVPALNLEATNAETELMASLTKMCRAMHEGMRTIVQDTDRLEDEYLANELMYIRPDLNVLGLRESYLRLIQNLGIFANSWVHRDWFDITLGSSVTPVFMTSTPLYDDDDIKTPRFTQIIPNSPAGDMELVTILTHSENHALTTTLQTLGVLCT